MSWKEGFEKRIGRFVKDVHEYDYINDALNKRVVKEAEDFISQEIIEKVFGDLENELPPLTIIHGQQRVINRTKLVSKLHQLRDKWLDKPTYYSGTALTNHE